MNMWGKKSTDMSSRNPAEVPVRNFYKVLGSQENSGKISIEKIGPVWVLSSACRISCRNFCRFFF